jgi:hypothetical protein
MPTLLVHFISDFLRDPGVRCAVLKNEVDGARAYGLDDAQIAVLKTLDKKTILDAVLEELMAIGVDMDAKKNEVFGGGGGGGGGGALALANMYSAGGIHPRKAVPNKVPAGADCTVVIAGNGFDKHVAVRFSDGTNPPIAGRVVSVECGHDLYQRVEVEVNLPAGVYTVEARNSPNEPWSFGGSGNPAQIQVTAA